MSFYNGLSSHLGRVNRYLPLERMGQVRLAYEIM